VLSHGLRTRDNALRTKDSELRTKNMERVINKAKNFREAEQWDIHQQIAMTAEERQLAARELQMRVYGTASSRPVVSAGQSTQKLRKICRKRKKK